ncbi:hypothetical protein Kpol_534p16 [Vanderwaltozyma polyspora DSM 70294]|uniref:Mannosyltransferase n=1 Tax=Vanderwaltozyma polyspora (strain ATCC 22028 / DSM 70294 / BCRC 21397 / CBS 2163 / NBRC 10782 / NRRL Y-8283 / UCD 57-17) TaxID=436907 RepID=A7TJJ4_VANPO|nr:uncharacterized protein Kpol_534p16 [Vanderwaltozyma polyspora DSM 70294]EDO17537.1 hypothetical protein Kpol_534p16 [Vanderwaltozyma polyspora DSM 70294]
MPDLLLIVLLRFANACLTRTFFQADEFWQSLEPAHVMAFGYGELTWEWKFGLRSYAFPLLFEILYRFILLIIRLYPIFVGVLLKVLGWLPLTQETLISWGTFFNSESTISRIEYLGVIYGPKLLMSVISGLGEYYTLLFVQKLYLLTFVKENDNKPSHLKNNVYIIAKVLTLSNLFNCFCISRTFINSFEMSLTAISLYYWDWTQGNNINSKDFKISLFIAISTCLQRPSNGLIWLVLGGTLLLNLSMNRRYKDIFMLLRKIIEMFLLAFALNTSIDYYFYKELTFPIFRFIKFNFTSPLSRFYGVAPWNFHLFQSLPILLGYSLPFFIYGLCVRIPTREDKSSIWNPIVTVKLSIVINIIIFSVLSHKEFRFIYQLQPLFILISTMAISKLNLSEYLTLKRLSFLKYLVPLVSVLISLTLCYCHESGSIAVMKYLHNKKTIDSLGFIMPCHSTPWQSYLHRNDIKSLWAITCDPPLHLLEDKDAIEKLQYYMDESDYLYDNIPKFMSDYFPSLTINNDGKNKEYEWPEYLVIFEHLDDEYMNTYLQDSIYTEEIRFFNSLVHWDHRRAGDLIVYHKSQG